MNKVCLKAQPTKESANRRLARRIVAQVLADYSKGVDLPIHLNPDELLKLLRVRRLAERQFDSSHRYAYASWCAEARLAIRYLGLMQAGWPACNYESWSFGQFGKPDPRKRTVQLEKLTGQLSLI